MIHCYSVLAGPNVCKSNNLAILCDLFGMVKWPFQGLTDLQLGDQKVTLNHLEGKCSPISWESVMAEAIKMWVADSEFWRTPSSWLWTTEMGEMFNLEMSHVLPMVNWWLGILGVPLSNKIDWMCELKDNFQKRNLELYIIIMVSWTSMMLKARHSLPKKTALSWGSGFYYTCSYTKG